MKRRSFLQALGVSYSAAQTRAAKKPQGRYLPGRIANEYSLFLPGEKQALAAEPKLKSITQLGAVVETASGERTLHPGDLYDGWQLITIANMNGTATAVFEKHVTHQGSIVYATESEGVILRIPKRIGKLSSIRPRQTNTPHSVTFTRHAPYVPGPDAPGNYILESDEDPCYENVAALGAEYIGYTLVSNNGAGPLRSLFLEADGLSRQLAVSRGEDGSPQPAWAPDTEGRLFDPSRFLPGPDPIVYRYLPGSSKRTLLGGYLPVANIGVWNPEWHTGYEVMVLLPRGENTNPIARIRVMVTEKQRGARQASDGAWFVERYWNTSAPAFWEELAGIANYWQHLFEENMPVEIPDQWLLDAARAGITLSRCSYRGLEPTYQIGEGAYTKIPERSHALFPVAHYEFIWAHQLWNLTREAEPYFAHYLDKYILPDGNFLYNTQDQVEAPLNTGVFLWNSARAFDYSRDIDALRKRLPALRRMIDYVLRRYEYGKSNFAPDDRRHGLLWGSPEADLGSPQNDFPNSHPLYFQNSVWTWRGLHEHARCLALAGAEHGDRDLENEAKRVQEIANEMRRLFETSLQKTIAAGTEEMRTAGITPFSPDDVRRKPNHLTSYENHRVMMDWFTADWGDPKLDLGHLKHREIAGQQIMGLHTDGNLSRTSNFMEHGTLAVKIRQDDYRPFLLTLYSLLCYAADSGNRYSPEDAYLPGSFPGDGSPYGWSAVVNSVLQPALGLRWLLCYEEANRNVCHLQKAAPKHWFGAGQRIKLAKCPTRFGMLSWTTEALGDREWKIELSLQPGFRGDIIVHIHPVNGSALTSSSVGKLNGNTVLLDRQFLNSQEKLILNVRS